MWKRIATRYAEWDREFLAMLRQPELAAAAASGRRRKLAHKVARLSPVERQEMLLFATTYRGATMWRSLAKLCLVFSVLGALFKLALKPELSMLQVVITANALGFLACFALVIFWFNHSAYARPGKRMLARIAALVVLGGLYGGAVAMLFKGGGSSQEWIELLPKALTATGFVVLLLVVPGILLSVVRNRHHALLAAKLMQEAEAARLARELSETQLRLLRAQIEPHFLFNTLGAVQQLAEQGAPKAAELTAHLIDFLRAGTGDMQRHQVPLENEFALVDSYLRVMQIRMGARLRYRIDLPAALTPVQVPSMIVLTLAENAIKHGIEPSLAGGEIEIAAREEAGKVCIRVRDSGVGMSDTPGNGTGLENVRHRLRLAYGPEASLALSEAEPGLLAEIAIPRREQQ